MRVLVTGATGLVGNAIARRAVAKGYEVRALVRDAARAKALLPAEVALVAGDVTDPPSVRAAAQSCDAVFHAAGMPEQFARDPEVFDRVNRQGTRHVLEAAREAGVRRAVYTSTMDVFAAPPGGTLVEDHLDPHPKPTHYERSKQAAEREAEEVRARGLEVVYLNPSAVYGPSPVHVSLNTFFIDLLNGRAPLLPPGGMSVVFVDGCADAHLAALERGESGRRYLLSDAHVTNRALAELAVRLAGRGRVPPVAPLGAVKALAAVGEPLGRLFGFKPPLSRGQLSFLTWDVRVDASRAERELGFRPTPVEEGVARTLASLREQRVVP